MMAHVKNAKENGIDLFKLIMSICVVAIHTHPLNGCENKTIQLVYHNIVSLAVPFFFIASGFLLSSKMEENSSLEKSSIVVKSYLKRMIRLYIFWMAVYFPLDVFGMLMDGYSAAAAIKRYIRDYVFVGAGFYSWSLWYLLSTIYAVCLIFLIMKAKGRYTLLVAT